MVLAYIPSARQTSLFMSDTPLRIIAQIYQIARHSFCICQEPAKTFRGYNLRSQFDPVVAIC